MILNRTPFSLLLFAVAIFTGCHSRTSDKLLTNSVSADGNILLPDTHFVPASWSKSNTLVVQLTTEPDNLHPTNGTSGQRAELFAFLHRFIVTTAHGNGLEPDLVESFPAISADGLTYSYRLKPGIVWDDGSPLTAEDVYFTCKVNAAPSTNNPAYKPYWMNLKDVIIDPKDPLRFELVMKRPHQQNISFLTGFPILQRSYFDPENLLGNFSLVYLTGNYAVPPPRALFEAFNHDSLGRKPKCIRGLGEYRVKEWIPGSSIRLQRKRNAPQHPDEIVFRIAKDEQAVSLDLKNQVFDVSTYLSTTTFLQLAADVKMRNNYHCVLSPTYNYSYLCFNTRPGNNRTPYYSDNNIRKAISYLVPVEQIIQLLFQQYSSASRRMLSPVSPFKPDFDSTLLPIPQDIPKAEQLLAKAGYSDADNDGILDKNGVPFDTELLYLNSSADWKDMAGLIADALGKAGIRVRPVAVEQKIFLEKARSHDFDLLLGSWGGSALPEDFAQLWSTSSWKNYGSNYSGFGDASSDSLINAINTTVDDSVRTLLSHRLQQLIYDEQPYVFLYSSLRRNIVHKRWGNITLFPERPGMDIAAFRLLNKATN